jgi:hypothetical protein
MTVNDRRPANIHRNVADLLENAVIIVIFHYSKLFRQTIRQRTVDATRRRDAPSTARASNATTANPASRSLTHVGGVKSVEPPDENKEPRIIIDEERTVNVKRSRTISRDRAAKINATYAENKIYSFFLLERIAAFSDVSLSRGFIKFSASRLENMRNG